MTELRVVWLALFLMQLTAAAQTAQRFDLVITEVMADPSPQVGLPNAEYVEIRNRSATAFNLSGWKLADAASAATISANFVLQPDSCLILCANSQVAALSQFGRVLGLSGFPSLDNDGELLSLHSPEGKSIHGLAYSSGWHQNSLKMQGGWSLEIIDIHHPCGGKENWTSSTAPQGGTPGQPNLVNGSNIDQQPPRLLRTWSLDSLTVLLIFSEPLDSTSAALASNYLVDNLAVAAARPQAPLFNEVALTLASPLQQATVYQVTTSSLTDCSGNVIGIHNRAPAGLAGEAQQLDIVINEILFNPKPSGYDYVELHNPSSTIIDLSKLYLANRDGSGNIGSQKRISSSPLYLFPGDYFVITEDANALGTGYLVRQPGQVAALSSLPSYPDDDGVVVLVSNTGAVIDEVAYSDKWHFALMSEPEGVALERIEPGAASQAAANWHSAASTAGYGTPTYRNSQYRQAATSHGTITVSPESFSPDNDGYDDILLISYQLSEAGYIATIRIFDAAGRPVKDLVRNELLGLKGSWTWDGLGQQYQRLPMGIYIVYTEMFNLEGRKQAFRKTVVLAGKP